MIKPAKLLLAALPLALAGCNPTARTASPEIVGTDISGAPIGGPFTLTDKDGKPVTWDQLRGRYAIIYFGYTFCPDACPLDVGVMMQAMVRFTKEHPELATKVQPVFITVDPARDTPGRIGEFTGAFPPGLLGLTGTQGQVDGAVKAFKAVAVRGKDVPGGYLMDHSRMAYLMDPQGRPLEALPLDKGPRAVAADLAVMVK